MSFLNFYFVLGYSRLTNNVVIVWGEQRRDSAIHTHVSILPSAPFPSRLPHNTEQSSLCYTGGPCWGTAFLNTLYLYQFFIMSMYWVSEVAQSCPTLGDPMNCSLPGSSVHGILQAIVLEWIAIPFSRGSSRPRDRTWVFPTVDRRFTLWATREVSHFISGFLLCYSCEVC